MIIQWIIQSGDLNISEVIFKSESQFNYLFTLKNAHLSSNSYIFGMQANIAMKFRNMWFESSSVSTVNLEKKITTVLEISNFS